MKILIVSWFFAPSNTIGAVRLGAIAGGLQESGHDVRVLTAAVDRYRQTLPVPLPEEQICRTKWFDINALPQSAGRRLREMVPGTGGRTGSRTGSRGPRGDGTAAAGESGRAVPASRGSMRRIVRQRLSDLYVNALNWPDWQIGWRPYAVRAGSDLVKSWQPDVVFASGPPFTTLLIGDAIARRFRLPLVVEFRDRWSDDPYYPPPRWRQAIDRWGERRIIGQARGLVTVSEPWADQYRRTYQKPILTMYNGYDNTNGAGDSPGAADSPCLTVRYLGSIYPGRRDPSTLFAAMKLMDTEPETATESVRAEFYGTNPDHVRPLAERHGVTHRVDVFPEVTHADSVVLQRTADALLLMQWNDPKEQGNIPGKFFEYLGARRPIIGLGYDQGVPARLITERHAGVYTNDPVKLAQTLREWSATKRSEGRLPALAEEACAGFSRREQVERLEAFLRTMAKAAETDEAAPAAHDLKDVSR